MKVVSDKVLEASLQPTGELMVSAGLQDVKPETVAEKSRLAELKERAEHQAEKSKRRVAKLVGLVAEGEPGKMILSHEEKKRLLGGLTREGISGEEYLTESGVVVASLKAEIDEEKDRGQDLSRKQWKTKYEVEDAERTLRGLEEIKGVKGFLKTGEKRKLEKRIEVLKKEMTESGLASEAATEEYRRAWRELDEVGKQRTEVLIREIGEEVGLTATTYQEMYNELPKRGGSIVEARQKYLDEVVLPMVRQRVESRGYGNVSIEELMSDIKTGLGELDRDGKVSMETREMIRNEGYAVEVTSELYPIIDVIDGGDLKIMQKLVIEEAARALADIQVEVRVPTGGDYRTSERIQHIVSRALHDSSASAYDFRDSFAGLVESELERKRLDIYGEGYPNMDYWECVKKSPLSMQEFGDWIKRKDEEMRQGVVEKSLTDTEGTHIDKIINFPSPEGIRLAVLLVAADNRGYTVFHGNRVIDELSRRADWPSMVDETIANYPEMEDLRGDLLHGKHEQYWRNNQIRKMAERTALGVLMDRSSEPNLKIIAVSALSDEAALKFLHDSNVLSGDERDLIERGIKTILAAPRVVGADAVDTYNLETTVRVGMLNLILGQEGEANLESKRIVFFSKLLGENSGNDAHLAFLSKKEVINGFMSGRVSEEEVKLFMEKNMDLYPVVGEYLFGNGGEINRRVDEFRDLVTLIDEGGRPAVLVHDGRFSDFLKFFNRDAKELVGCMGYLKSNYDIRYKINVESVRVELEGVPFNEYPFSLWAHIDQDILPGDFVMRKMLGSLNLSSGFIDAQAQSLLGGDVDLYKRQKILQYLYSVGSSQDREFYLGAIERNPELLTNVVLQTYVHDNIERLRQVPSERLQDYVEVARAVAISRSKEIRKLGDGLVKMLLKTDNPVEIYRKVEDVFVRNNLPLAGKVLRVFEMMNPRESLSKTLENPVLSPVLRETRGDLRRRDIIYRDLLSVQLRSGNLSLKEYMEDVVSGSDTAERFRKGEKLSPEEAADLERLVKRLKTLRDSSLMGRGKSSEATPAADLRAEVETLYRQFRVRDGQSLNERVAELFLYPLEVETVEEALEMMKREKQLAVERLRQNRQETYSLQEGDLVKGVIRLQSFRNGNGFRILDNILNNGSVAVEYLGSDATHDATPLDTDCSRVSMTDGRTFSQTYGRLVAAGYGDMAIVVKDRGQFVQKVKGVPAVYERGKYELIHTKVLEEDHYGVRTGFPSTEIDMIVVSDEMHKDTRVMQNLYFALAKEGLPIPIVTREGKNIFDDNLYKMYRKSLEGLDKFDGDALVVERASGETRLGQQVAEMLPSVRESSVAVEGRSRELNGKLTELLSGMGIVLGESENAGLEAASLENIGSSGRGTNMPGDSDFDYILLLGLDNYRRREEVRRAILEKFKHDGEIPGGSMGEHVQIRMTGVEMSDGAKADVDVGLNVREDELAYGSHRAVSDKLDYIEVRYGREMRDEVTANIVLAKKLLKEAHAYKKGSQADGGMGGIGVENWILQNNGSIERAFESFWVASHDETGGELGFREFQSKYSVYDIGTNLRGERYHDNFIGILTEDGYKKMLGVISGYREA